MKKIFVVLFMFIVSSTAVFAQTPLQLPNTQVATNQPTIEDLKREYEEIAVEFSRLNEMETKDMAEPIDTLILRVQSFRNNVQLSDISNKEELTKEVDDTLATLHYTKGLIVIANENNLKKAELLFIQAAKYNNIYSQKYLEKANDLISKQNYMIAEVFLNAFIETYTNSEYTLANAYRLRAKIRHNYLKNKFGAIEDNKKADELIK